MLPSHIQTMLDDPDNFTSPHYSKQRHIFGNCIWYVENLIDISATMPSFMIPLSDLRAISLESAFPGLGSMTYAEFAYHVKVAMSADLSKPIILGYDGRIMDGHHRILKSLITGQTEILCVQFVIDPSPDEYIKP